jgi:hypothetical protein
VLDDDLRRLRRLAVAHPARAQPRPPRLHHQRQRRYWCEFSGERERCSGHAVAVSGGEVVVVVALNVVKRKRSRR